MDHTADTKAPADATPLAEQVEYWRNRALRAEHEATHDALTGRLNRRGLYEAVASPAGLIVTVFDVDGLKTVNDTLGHAAGDAFLRSIATKLERIARKSGAVALARTGGDEFVMVSRCVPSVPERVSASHGSVECTPGMALDDAIREADARMYVHKVARNRARTR